MERISEAAGEEPGAEDPKRANGYEPVKVSQRSDSKEAGKSLLLQF